MAWKPGQGGCKLPWLSKPPESDALNSLFQEARAGDRGALDRLLRRVRPLIYKKARFFVGKHDVGISPTSLTQESSVALARTITRVRGSGSNLLMALINKLVSSQGIDAYRHQHRDKRDVGRNVPMGDVESALAAPQTAPDERLDQQRRTHRLLVAIAQLPPRQRAALQGVLGGQPVAQIAAELGCGEIAVANLLQRAKQRLQQQVEADASPAGADALVRYLRRREVERGGPAADPASEVPAELRPLVEWLESVRPLWVG